MRFKVLLIFFSIFSVFLTGSETILLPDLLKPDSLHVNNKNIFITEGVTIYVYSAEDFKLLKKFGKKGEGPGEIAASRRGGTSYSLSTINDYIFIHNRNKVLFFEKDGTLKSEKKLSGGFIRGLHPAGNNYVGRVFKMGSNRSERTSLVTLFDKDFKKIKDIFKESTSMQRRSFLKIYSAGNQFKLKTEGKNIYINNTKDFVIKRFDSTGKALPPIKVNYALQKVTGKEKENIKSYYKNSSRFSSFWERIKNSFEISDIYPAIKEFFVDSEKIYVQTHKKTGNKHEFYIFSRSGKLLNKKFFSLEMLNYMEEYPFYINSGKVFQLIEDEDEEEWSLQITDI
ncbi:MAG: hypothetical protein ABFR75_06520 [Acidobacteriota bacterium]